MVECHNVREVLTIEVRRDVLAVEIEGLIGLASVRRYPIGGIVVGGVVIADGVVFARMEVVGFYYVQILGLVFVDGEEALEGFARVHIHHLKGVLVGFGHKVPVVQKQLVSHTVDSGAVCGFYLQLLHQAVVPRIEHQRRLSVGQYPYVFVVGYHEVADGCIFIRSLSFFLNLSKEFARARESEEGVSVADADGLLRGADAADVPYQDLVRGRKGQELGFGKFGQLDIGTDVVDGYVGGLETLCFFLFGRGAGSRQASKADGDECVLECFHIFVFFEMICDLIANVVYFLDNGKEKRLREFEKRLYISLKTL